jgi:diadenosine tetraphosphate (Ap4A) HIT family hydrolase
MTDRGWPDDWDERKAGVDCPLCAGLGSESDDDHAVFVTELTSSEVRLERRSRLPGYCMVIWRHGHVAEPTELDAKAASEYWSDLLTLGNWVPHLHTHVVPRYPNDPAPGGPITWADIFNEHPTPPEVLHGQAAVLRARLNAPN